MGQTNALGAGKRNVTASISDALYGELARLAEKSGVGVSTYATCALVHAAESGLIFENARAMRVRAANLESPQPINRIVSRKAKGP